MSDSLASTDAPRDDRPFETIHLDTDDAGPITFQGRRIASVELNDRTIDAYETPLGRVATFDDRDERLDVFDTFEDMVGCFAEGWTNCAPGIARLLGDVAQELGHSDYATEWTL